ncbi:MAG: cytochrome P460 family protein [Polyangiales bacterium]
MTVRALPALSLSLLALSLGSCGPDDPAAPAALVPASYASYTQVRGCRTTTEHLSAASSGAAADHVRVLTSPEAASAYLANAPTLPTGTVVIKEEFNDPDCARVTAWTVMRKEQGYDPAHGDWHWQRVRADYRERADGSEERVVGAVLEDGRVSRCFNCHDTPACVARDWMCTEP